LRRDLREMIAGMVKNRMRFSILSNGTLITDDMAAYLKSTHRCDHVQVSIDGASPGVHDSCRGKGNFERAVAGIRTLQRHQVPVAVRVTIHKHNVDDLDQIAHLLLDELKLGSFSTNSASPMGLCRANAARVALDTTESQQAMETLLRLNATYNGRIGAQAGPLAEARAWKEMELARREGKPGLPGRGHLQGCGGVFSKIAVRADGVLAPCNMMSHIELGRINQDDLREVWHTHPELERLRQRRQIPLSDFDYCRDCAYHLYCTGNCPATAFTHHQLENHPSPEGCLRLFLEDGGKIPGV